MLPLHVSEQSRKPETANLNTVILAQQITSIRMRAPFVCRGVLLQCTLGIVVMDVIALNMALYSRWRLIVVNSCYVVVITGYKLNV